MRRIKNQSGFTLIEVMIVVVIIGILASIAYPQYEEFVRRGKRGDGIAAIQLVLEAQERYYADHLSYTSTASDLRAPTTSPQGNYTISLGACSGATLAQCVQVTATAVGGQAQDGNLVANTRGEKKRIKNGNTLEWK